MKNKQVIIERYDADEGMVFDYASPRFIEDENGILNQQHLYATTLYLSKNDSIDNYIEIEKPVVEQEEGAKDD